MEGGARPWPVEVNSDSLTMGLSGVLRRCVSFDPTPGVWPITATERFCWSRHIKHSAPLFELDDVPFVLVELICVEVASSEVDDCVVLDESDSPASALGP